MMTSSTPSGSNSESANPTAIKREAVYAYCAAGFALFPCSAAKAPVKDCEWQLAESEPLLEPEDLPAAYGVVLPRNICVIDIDPNRYSQGENQLQKLVTDLKLETPQKTFMVSTGRGGLHIYYRLPDECIVHNQTGIPGYSAIDVKTGGGYVIGAGSICESGRQYVSKRLTPSDIAPIPYALLELIRYKGTEKLKVEIDDGVLDEPAAVAKFVVYCKNCAPAIEGAGGDSWTFKVALTGRDYRLSDGVVFDVMQEYFNPRCGPPWDDADLAKKVSHAYRYAKSQAPGRLDTAKSDFAGIPAADLPQYREKWHEGGPKHKPTFTHTVNYLLREYRADMQPNPLRGILKFNEFSGKVEFMKAAPWHKQTQTQWSDTDTKQLLFWLSYHEHYEVPKGMLEDALEVAAQEQSFHPIKEYLNGLQWDGVPRVDNWLQEYCRVYALNEAHGRYVTAIGKGFFLSAVARALQPAVKNDSSLILEGRQGCGKSTAVSILGGAWYADVPLRGQDRDTVAKLRGKWVVEISELAYIRKADIDSLKAFLTRVSDEERLAYERHARSYARCCVFVGTTNNGTDEGYLADPTGNRRFWPVKVGKIKLDELERDRDQLWAEAFVRYQRGEHWWIEDKEILAEAEEQQFQRRSTDPWEQRVMGWCEEKKTFTSDDVFEQALNLAVGSVDVGKYRRLGAILRANGYSQVQLREKDKRIRAWMLDPLED